MSAELRSVSPADPDDELGRFPVADAAAVDAAVARARAAFPAWRDAGFEARAAVIRRFRDAARAGSDELARLIAREVGKALWDARGEAALLPAKVDVTLEEGMRFVAPIEAGPGVRATYHPRGVLAVLGPFNFPAHLPNGHIVPALATGNTVVLKPSELAPAAAEWMGALWREAGLPEGVLEIVHGGADTGRAPGRPRGRRRRALHRLLRRRPRARRRPRSTSRASSSRSRWAATTPSSCSATPTSTSQSPRPRSRSPSPPVSAAPARAVSSSSAASSTPSRRSSPGCCAACASGRRSTRASSWGRSSRRPPSTASPRRASLAGDAGGERVLLVPPPLPPPYVGPGLVRFATAAQTHPYQRDEIFGPEAALYPVGDLDEAIAAANDSDYGLAAAVFTRDRAKYEHCVGRIRTGNLNWNKGTVGASGKLPFGGSGRSGNDRPAGITATVYCTFPQAHLESEAGFDPETLPPGMPRP